MKNQEKGGKFHVVYLGESGFPIGLAAIQKTILLGKALRTTGARMTVINRKGKFKPDQPVKVDVEGDYEGIHYVYTSGSVYKPKGFFNRNILKLKGIIGEYQYLRRLAKNGDLDAGIISCRDFIQVLLYRLYSFMLGFPIALLYVEFASAMQHRQALLTRINDYLFDNLMVKRMDAALPISELLADNFRKVAPGKPIFKIPVICDFKPFEQPRREGQEPYFLYCGALDYKEVVDFILDSFDNMPGQSDTKLHLLVSGGKKSQYEQLDADIRKMKKADKVRVFSNVPYSELIDLYVNAIGLLIPLRPTLQDAARFPHKIGEYTAAANPIITTRVGEVPHYFEDGKTALISDNYDVAEYAAKMKFVVDHPGEAARIGEQGRELGLREFNYINYGPRLKSFLGGLNGNGNGKHV
ncbi:MAG: glycosyltransferase [Phaeodactylibacter sp.]|nr:glycosyltransferase [Phaeodactylibacter sp.]MCB9048957.1 glycosyltransferase [Lewinellaceae bacterium]